MTESSPEMSASAPRPQAIRLENRRGVKLKDLPGKAEFHEVEAHIYVVAMNNGIIKVGYSNHPRRRIGLHAQNAGAFGAAVTGVWVSPPCRNARGAEKALINYGCAYGTVVNNNEYFKGIAFGDIVAYAENLELEPISENAIAAVKKRRRDHFATLRTLHGLGASASIPAPTPEPNPDLAAALHDAIGSFMGRKADGSYIMPAPNVDMNDPDFPIEFLDKFVEFAEMQGVPSQQILDMSWPDIHAALIRRLAENEAELFKQHALRVGYVHMTEPVGEYLFRMIDERNAIWAAKAEAEAKSSTGVE